MSSRNESLNKMIIHVIVDSNKKVLNKRDSSHVK